MSLFSIKQEHISDTCWFAVQCLARLHEECYIPEDLTRYVSIMEIECPDFMFIPSVPILFDDIYLTYIKNQSRNIFNTIYLYFYLCSKNSSYENYFVNHKKMMINDFICYRNISWQFDQYDSHIKQIFTYQYGSIHRYNPFWKYSSEICQRSNMYQCQNSSKCISIDRLNDGIDDCMYSDDENQSQLPEKSTLIKTSEISFRCPTSKKLFSRQIVNDGKCDCGYDEYDQCEDEKTTHYESLSYPRFPFICNGLNDLASILIDGKMQNDETECENWPCHNYYTRCNGFWNCLNGEDELNCSYYAVFNCSPNEHICYLIGTRRLICLPLEKVNDGIRNCHGSMDEPQLCQRNTSLRLFSSFQCRNDTMNRCFPHTATCNGIQDCPHGDDEQFCGRISSNLISYQTTQLQFDSNSKYCHGGFSLLVWLNKEENISTRVCFCPTYAYGNECQYQNQRVNLFVKFKTIYNSFRSIFQAIILLIDDSNERTIHSYKQSTFMRRTNEECWSNHYNLFSLIYSTRPKDMLKNYSIHIDIYEKLSLNYRGSFTIPIEFSFLPVHYLVKTILIPRNNRTLKLCSNRQCNYHGKCIQYLNQTKEKSFCQCERGWTGKFCSISYQCLCSSDALCLGISAMNRSVCICPVNRTGSRCLIRDLSCQINGTNPCQNNGQCIPHHEIYNRQSIYRQFSCLCRKGFSGVYCEIASQITLSFGKDVMLSTMIYVHLFDFFENAFSDRTTIPVRISDEQNSISIHWEKNTNLS